MDEMYFDPWKCKACGLMSERSPHRLSPLEQYFPTTLGTTVYVCEFCHEDITGLDHMMEDYDQAHGNQAALAF